MTDLRIGLSTAELDTSCPLGDRGRSEANILVTEARARQVAALVWSGAACALPVAAGGSRR